LQLFSYNIYSPWLLDNEEQEEHSSLELDTRLVNVYQKYVKCTSMSQYAAVTTLLWSWSFCTMWVVVTISTASSDASHLLILEECRVEVTCVVVEAT